GPPQQPRLDPNGMDSLILTNTANPEFQHVHAVDVHGAFLSPQMVVSDPLGLKELLAVAPDGENRWRKAKRGSVVDGHDGFEDGRLLCQAVLNRGEGGICRRVHA